MTPAAQLIAEIAIHGIDLFITDMGKASNATDSFRASLDMIVPGLGSFQAAIESAFSSIGVNVGGVMTGVVASIGTGAAALAAFTKSAIQEAAKVQGFKLSEGGLFGDMSMGDRIVDYSRQRAKELMIASDTLLAANLRLDAAGINSGHFSKMISTFGKITGGNPSDFMMFADAIARGGTGGNLGMAMRPLRKVGIGLDDFKNEGITVTGNNQIKATGDQFLKALDSIYVKKGFERIANALKDSMSVAFVDLQDSWNILLEKFGKSFFPLVTTLIKAVTPFIDFLSDSGEMEKMGKAFNDAFASVFGHAGGQNTIIKFLTFFVTAMEMLPGAIQTAGTVALNVGMTVFRFFDKVITNLFNAWQEFAVGFFNFFNNLNNQVNMMLNRVMDNVIRLGNMMGLHMGPARTNAQIEADVLGKHPAMVEKRFNGIGDVLAAAMQQIPGLKDLAKFPADFLARQNQMLKAYDDYLKNPKAALVNPEGDGIFNKNHTFLDDTAKIEANTSKMAAHMDKFAKFVIGGGDRGKFGISASEFYGRAGVGSRSVKIDGGSATSMLERAVNEMIGEAVQSMRRSRYATH